MSKNTLWAVMIKNSIRVICWVVLAIIFSRWWIALFALLFMTSYETKHRYFRYCDKCGKRGPYAETYNDALDKAKAAGWLHISEGNKDYCPGCQHK
jgi:hypothetical protein